jgi:RNA polymerase sigma factor (sigma-70 family)
MTNPPDPVADLSETVKGSWHRFLDVYEPLRPELYRYCRYLTRSPWDAEDLAQDAMARAFVTLGCMAHAPPNPRAWLFRVASNLWIDRTRRTREEPGVVPELSASHEPRDPREAAGTLIVRLSPQECAAVVLKDVFDLTLEEIAEAAPPDGLPGGTGGPLACADGRGGFRFQPPAGRERRTGRGLADRVLGGLRFMADPRLVATGWSSLGRASARLPANRRCRASSRVRQ